MATIPSDSTTAIIFEALEACLPVTCKTQVLTKVHDALVRARRQDYETEVLIAVMRKLARGNRDLDASGLFEDIDELRSITRREFRKDLVRIVEARLPKADGTTLFNIVSDLCAVLRI